MTMAPPPGRPATGGPPWARARRRVVSLLEEVTPVDRDDHPRDVAGHLGAEEDHHVSDVLRIAEAAEHALLARAVQDLGGYRLGEPRRPDIARRDGVHVDVRWSQLHGGGTREPEQPCLRGRIIGQAELAPEAVDGADVDDLAVLLRAEQRRDRADHVDRAGQVRLDDLAPLLIRHAPQRAVPADPGVVDQDVQRAEALPGAAHEAFHGARIPHVALGAEDLDLEQPQLAGGPLRLLRHAAVAVVDVVEGDVHAVLRQFERDRAADAGRATGHDRAQTAQVAVGAGRVRARLLYDFDQQLFQRLVHRLAGLLPGGDRRVRPPRPVRTHRLLAGSVIASPS